MKREDLFEAIGGVEDLLLEENVAPAGKRHWMPYFVSAAACAAIIAAVKVLPADRRIDIEEIHPVQSEIRITETYYQAAPGRTAETEPYAVPSELQVAEIESKSILVLETRAVIQDISETCDELDTEEFSTEAETIVENETSVISNTAPFESKENTFGQVLAEIYENRSFMGISFNTYPAYDISANQFALYDVDGDSSDELVFLWKETDMASMLGMIYGKDAEGNITMEFWGNPFIHIYSNGLIKHDDSHNQGLSGRFWPYTLCSYDAASDTYEVLYAVSAWDSEAQPSPEEAYPEDADVSSSGIVYYVGEQGPLDVTDFEAWERETFGDAVEIDLPFQSFTEENIASLLQ